MKTAFVETYRTENKVIIGELLEKHEKFLESDLRRFEWKRHHDYAKNYVYLAKFYSESGLKNAEILESKKDALKKAADYFKLALNADSKQPTTHWEMGQLNYRYPKDYGVKDNINAPDAIDSYDKAIELYTARDIAKGWRADPYRMKAIIYVDSIKNRDDKYNPRKFLPEAKSLLQKAKSEYENAIPETRRYNEEGLKEVKEYLQTVDSLYQEFKIP